MLTPEFRAAFISVFRPTASKDNPDGPKKYAIRAVFMPGTDLSGMKSAAQAAVAAKWPAGAPKNLRNPFRKNADLDNPIPNIPDDAVVATFSSGADRRPGLVDAQLNEILDESRVYPGAWFRAEVRAFAYDAAGNRGVGFGLNNVQLLRDDDHLGGGRVPASKVFAAVPVAQQSEVDEMFS